MTFTPGGRDIPNLDVSVQLGTRQGEEGYEDGRAGFTRETDPLFGFGGTHTRVPNWYAGTADLFPTHFPFDSESDEGALFRRRGDGYYDHLYDEAFPRVSPWYSPDHLGSEFAHGEESAPWEGIGTGWFYSALGGGSALDLRPSSDVERVPMAFDNTYDAPMRGDFAVPTLFNGNFDAVFQPKDGFRNLISDAVPGWSFHNGGNRVSTSQLVDLKDVGTLEEHLQKVGNDPSSDGYQTDYALKLGDGDKITHNRFLVPDWGVLRFDLHAPTLNGGEVKVIIKDDSSGEVEEETIFLTPADGTDTFSDVPYFTGYTEADTYRIGYGAEGFETFHVEIPQELRGKVATLEFQVTGNTQVLLDDVFFKSQHLLLGNPSDARTDVNSRENYLIEKPQYAVSYNDAHKTPNWVSWQLNKSWIGNAIRPGASDAPLGYPPTGFPGRTPFSAERADYPWLGDHQIPAGWERTEGPDYRYNQRGMERGHMAPVADRTRANKDVFATFLTSNLIPQHGHNNRGAWESFEKAIRKQFNVNNRTTSIDCDYYIVAGGYGYDPNDPERKIRNLIDEQLRENPKGILIPEYTWKIVVPLLSGQGISDIDGNTEPVAIMVPNKHKLQATPQNPKEYPLPGEETREITNWNDWRSWQVPIDYLEKRTGYDFLSELPENVQEILESKIDGILPT